MIDVLLEREMYSTWRGRELGNTFFIKEINTSTRFIVGSSAGACVWGLKDFFHIDLQRESYIAQLSKRPMTEAYKYEIGPRKGLKFLSKNGKRWIATGLSWQATRYLERLNGPKGYIRLVEVDDES